MNNLISLDAPPQREWLQSTYSSNFQEKWKAVAIGFLYSVDLLVTVANEVPCDSVFMVHFMARNGRLQIEIQTNENCSDDLYGSIRLAASGFQALAKTCTSDVHDILESTVPSELLTFGPDSNSSVVDAPEKVDELSESSDDESSDDESSGAEPKFLVFKNLMSAKDFAKSILGRDSETSQRIKALNQRLNQIGPMRSYKLPSDDWRALLSVTLTEFPNFHKVLQTVVHPLLALQSMGVLSRMPPMLLVGPPGVGKSYFANRIAKLLNVWPLVIDFASESNGGALNGSSVFWANSSPGKVFQQVAFGAPGQAPIANPVIVIDEVDKVIPGQKFDPMAGLYALLEEDSAKQFEDQAVPGLILDLSHVRFILTANDIDLIPAPILSRLMVFEIDAPSRAESLEITQRMFVVQVEKLGMPFDLVLPMEVLEDAASVSPRKCKTRLGTAIGIAVANGLPGVDMSTWLLTDTSRSVQVSKMGFV